MSILALLQLVVSLLIALQSNPNVPLAVRQQVIDVASQAVQVAVAQLGAQGTSPASVTQQQAIAIVGKDAGISPSSTQYTFTASLTSANNWRVTYAPNQPTCVAGSPCMAISGGNASYVIDGSTGAILSKALGQ